MVAWGSSWQGQWFVFAGDPQGEGGTGDMLHDWWTVFLGFSSWIVGLVSLVQVDDISVFVGDSWGRKELLVPALLCVWSGKSLLQHSWFQLFLSTHGLNFAVKNIDMKDLLQQWSWIALLTEHTWFIILSMASGSGISGCIVWKSRSWW